MIFGLTSLYGLRKNSSKRRCDKAPVTKGSLATSSKKASKPFGLGVLPCQTGVRGRFRAHGPRTSQFCGQKASKQPPRWPSCPEMIHRMSLDPPRMLLSSCPWRDMSQRVPQKPSRVVLLENSTNLHTLSSFTRSATTRTRKLSNPIALLLIGGIERQLPTAVPHQGIGAKTEPRGHRGGSLPARHRSDTMSLSFWSTARCNGNVVVKPNLPLAFIIAKETSMLPACWTCDSSHHSCL